MKAMKILYIVLICHIFIEIGFSQELKDIRIVKIIDTNLFLSEEGQLIKLAEVQSPNLFSDDSVIAKKIIKYATNYILNSNLSYLQVYPKLQNDTLFIHLFREYDLSTTCFNEEYLKLGFGIYKKMDKLPLNEYFLEAEDDARFDEVGIWQKKQIDYPRSHSLLFKYSNKFKEDRYDDSRTFRQFIYIFYKQDKVFQLSISRFFREYFGREGGKKLELFFVPRLYGNSDNGSINLGFCIIKQNGGEGPETMVFPTTGFNFRFYNQLYAHFNFVDENIYSFWNYGITHKFNHPYTEFTIGKSYHADSEWSYYFNGQISVLNLLQFQAQGKYNFKKEFGYFLFGIGFVLNE